MDVNRYVYFDVQFSTCNGFEQVIHPNGRLCRLCGIRVDGVKVELSAVGHVDDFFVSSECDCHCQY